MTHARSRALSRCAFPKRPRCGLAVLLSLTLLTSLNSGAAAQDDYRLGPQDKIRVKVSEWRPTTGETFEWNSMSGEFTINSLGMLSVPIIGAIHAEGTTVSDLSMTISERLKATAGLIRSPSAAVEIAQYRPFYIVGEVERPGEYMFRPDLNVLQAVSIAGGFYRLDSSLTRFEREAIAAEGEINISEALRLAMLLRRDRLFAEERNLPTIVFSTEVTAYPDHLAAAQGIREESALFASRQTGLQSQIELLTQAKALLENELVTLAAKEVNQRKQLDLVRRELENISSLVTRGLAVNPRQLSLEQNVAQIESQGLDLTVASARTRQEISRTQRSMAELRNLRQTDINRELRETQVSLRQATERINAQRLLIYDSRVSAPQQLSRRFSEAFQLNFRIIRRRDGKPMELSAQETDPVLPGDILKIERPLLTPIGQPEAAGGEAGRS